MKLNSTVCIVGCKTVLVPYRAHHVAKYHQWMRDPALMQLTASEPLTLQQEYDMQQTWLHDTDKCTFIVLARPQALELETILKDDVDYMAGDVNLFINDGVAEVEVMIAEQKYRRLGFGKECVALMMLYAVNQLQIKKFEAKIGMDNFASLKLFEDGFGFEFKEESQVFREKTLKVDVNLDYKNKLRSISGNYTIEDGVILNS